jgi:DNA-binding response OmpR family regulator
MRVLLVDDESLIRKSLRRVFEFHACEVKEAEDGTSGLKIWKDSDPDLVILDVLMPGMTGPQILKEMGAHRKAKVVLISAYTGEYDRNKATELGADLFIPKPFNDIFSVVTQSLQLIQPLQGARP